MKKRKHFEKIERIIMELLSERGIKGLSPDTIIHALPTKDISLKDIKISFSRLLETRKIILQKNRVFINPNPNPSIIPTRNRSRQAIVEGVVSIYKNGQLIINSQKLPEPVLVFPENTLHAIPGDIVQLMLLQKRTKKHQTAKVIRIQKRAGLPFLIMQKDGVTITKPSFDLPLAFIDNKFVVQENVWYQARITSNIHLDHYDCQIEKAVSTKQDLDVIDLIHRYSLPHAFSAECIKESHQEPLDEQKRIDLCHLTAYTIDGIDAQDFDDAISLQKNQLGYTLWIHISDVSHFVPINSALDQEAFKRGTSVYFPKDVIPMLPEELSNNLCSLKPGEMRKTVTCEMHFNLNGKLQKAFIYPSLLKSSKRFTYEEVQAILEQEQESPFGTELQHCLELANLLEKNKFQAGAIDFNFPEIKIELTTDADVQKIGLEPRLAAHRIVEEFMLASNEVIAQFCSQTGIDTIYRHQPPPGEQDLRELEGVLKSVRLSLPAGKERFQPKTYQKLVNSLTPDIKDFIQPLILRSMRQAIYSEKQCTHFGLAKDYYCHFTSPIRRYPDLTMHRQLLNTLKLNNVKLPFGIFPLPPEVQNWQKPKLANSREQAIFTSVTERRAIEVEREYQQRKKAVFATKYVGQSFTARINGMISSGLFLEILDFPVEGFLSFENLSGYWSFNDKTMCAERQRKTVLSHDSIKVNTLRLGDLLEITIHSVEQEKYRINFRLKQSYETAS